MAFFFKSDFFVLKREIPFYSRPSYCTPFSSKYSVAVTPTDAHVDTEHVLDTDCD